MARRRAQVNTDDDEDPDDAPMPKGPASTASDVEQLVWLLDTCRKRGYALGPTVKVGRVTANVIDVRLPRREGLRAGDVPAGAALTDIWREHGHDRDEDEPIEGTSGH